MPTSQKTANRCYDDSCPPHCNFHTRKELNTLLFRFLAINQILHFKTYFGDLHSPMLGGLMHRCEAGLAPYFQYEDFFLLFPLRLRLRFVTVWTDTSTPVSLSSSSSILISKSLLFTFFCLHKRWPQVFLLLFPTAILPAKPGLLSPGPSTTTGIQAEPLETSMTSQPSQTPAGNLHFRDSHSHWVLTSGRQGAPRLGKCLPLPHDIFLSCWNGHFPHHMYSPSRDIWVGWNFPHGVAHQLPGQSNTLLLMYCAALLSYKKNLCCNLCHKTQTPLLIDVEALYNRVFL